MPVTTITSKGQVTIPKQVRDELHLRTGDRVDFRIEQDGSVRLLPLSTRVADVFAAFEHKATAAKSVAEMNQDVAKSLSRKSP